MPSTMTVQELQDILNQQPPEALVIYANASGYWSINTNELYMTQVVPLDANWSEYSPHDNNTEHDDDEVVGPPQPAIIIGEPF